MYRNSNFLKYVLMADAVTCFGAGLLLMLASSTLQKFLGLPAELLRYAGISLLPFAVWLVYLSTRDTFSRQMITAVIVLNALWTIDSILLLFTGWVAPTELGYAFVVAQALGVALFAGLEYFGLRKSTAVPV